MTKKILVVDDEWSLLELLRIKLSRQGYTVVTAKNAKEFRDFAFTGKPDLLILDIWLGEQGMGTQLYEEIVRAGFDSSIPVIFISALIEEGTPPKHAPKGGRFAMYPKPFDFDLMLAEIDQLLKGRESKELENERERNPAGMRKKKSSSGGASGLRAVR